MLNSAQTVAVHTLSGPLLVLAGAGTGKTRVVTVRVAKLIQSGIAPDRILAVTFTNKAAREMQERISQQLRGGNGPKPEISTFHSLCVRILRRQIHHLGFPNLFSIYDRGDQESVARKILRDIRVASSALRPGDFLTRISTWKSAGITAEMALNHIETSQDYIIAVAYARYQEALKTLGALDFDDLLLTTERLFREHMEVLQEEAGRFDHILVDEYQDTNTSQYNIVRGLALGHRNLCVVGDDDQAIYGWRGAEVEHILNFRNDWPEARVVRLEVNYRSTAQILEWANRLIAFNRARHEKSLRTDKQGERPVIVTCADGEAEAKLVVARIKERLKVPGLQPRDFAVLFRTNEQPRALELEFRSAKIPYTVIGGQSFFDRKEVKDVISWLKLILRPKDDVALLRVINTPPRGIGSTTVRKMTDTALNQSKPIWDVLSKETDSLGLDNKSQVSVNSFIQLVRQEGGTLRRHFTAEALAAFIEHIGYRREIDRLYPDKNDQEARWAAVGEVVSAAAAWLKENPNGTLSGFLDNTALGGPDFGSSNEKKLDHNAVILMTLHAAKGLEFKEVYMVGMEEGTLPHHRSIDEEDFDSVDEERRLCYVGITRAKKRLTLTLAKTRLKWGKMRPTIPSRFLYEVTGQAETPHYLDIKTGKAQQAVKEAAKHLPPVRRPAAKD
ncbi:MAG: UvrD-helicase domain-containing protein [Planctomycetia bacterium]|nr:UvrD-helicase domain-containing protein [Planctomycetia bacterium]